jgi:hypothetical protein
MTIARDEVSGVGRRSSTRVSRPNPFALQSITRKSLVGWGFLDKNRRRMPSVNTAPSIATN